MKSKLILIIALSFILSPSLSGQDFFYNGYIITQNKDTITGKIQDLGLKKNSFQCSFMPHNTNKIDAYQPGELYAYFVNDKYYVSKKIKAKEYDTLQFAEYLVDGIKDLFSVYLDDKPFFLIEDESGMQFLVNIGKYKSSNKEDVLQNHLMHSVDIGTLRYVMNDYPPIFNQINNMNYISSKPMVRLMTNYHYAVCTSDDKCIDYTKKPIKPFIYIGINAGINYSTLKFSGDNYYQYLIKAEQDNSVSFYYGIDLSISVPSISERFSVDLMFEKSSERFTYDYEWLYYNGDSNVITDLAFDLNAYSVQFNYIILQRRFNVSPFFGLSKINIKNQTETNNLKAGYYRLPLEFDNAFLTFNFGVNFDTPLNVKKDLLLRTKLAYKLDRSNMLVTAGVAENYKSLSLGVTLFKRISGR